MKTTRRALNNIIIESLFGIIRPFEVANDTSYYWSARLIRGSDIQPGFEIPKSNITSKHKDASALEQIFEKARLQKNPSAPSRMSCIYLCPTSDGGFCRLGRNEYRKGGVYQVSVTGKVFIANASYFSEAARHWAQGNKNSAYSWALAYWECEKMEHARDEEFSQYEDYEALVDGSVIVTNRIAE